MRGAATGKARLPTVESLTEGTIRRLGPAERSFRRPYRSINDSNNNNNNNNNKKIIIIIIIIIIIRLLIKNHSRSIFLHNF